MTNNRVNAAHKSISEIVERVAKIASGYKTEEFCYWGIELKESHELIGEIDLYDFDKSTGNC